MKVPSLRGLRSPRVMAIAAIAAGGLVAAVLPSSAEVSAQSVPVAAIRVESPATLLARGAAVAVTVTVVCQPGSSGSVNIEVTENAGGRIAKGFESAQVPSCTGGFQPVTLNVAAEPTVPFRAGTAFGQASVFVNGPGGFNQARDDREFKIVRSLSRMA
ncbi:hypothetical protein [Actinocrispum wychmicini]|uniref:Uncharacterized protein n=1 Tax=Actinocrispum wychmicini TaxID=1213861 RepID=A0A4R2JU91_9PSEU|nr:hypothetical protein [Actinocrispum wychmicini]TCO62602.1 hypothetical protein EV192_102741 [Actinocrispum wychmicini]